MTSTEDLNDALARAAAAAGLATEFVDGLGQRCSVPADTLLACLTAMGLSADALSPDALSREIARRRRGARLTVLTEGKPLRIAGASRAEAGPCSVEAEDGTTIPAELSGNGRLEPVSPLPIGYHRLVTKKRERSIAYCPLRAWWPEWMERGERRWGLAAQIYSLRGEETHGFGNFADLHELIERLGDAGGESVLINPVAAGFLSQPHRKSPYQASDRRFLNAAVIRVGPEQDSGSFIDYRRAVPARLAALRRRFAEDGSAEAPDFAAWYAAAPPALRRFAAWEASTLHGPDPAAEDILFHAWLQYEADAQLGACAATARVKGMSIGLMRDLPVGPAQDGFERLSQADFFARDVDIGAPPDALAADGQNWGIAGFNPLALTEEGYDPFITLLRTNVRHAGALRIDHVMSLYRLFWIPRGAKVGAYVAYPFDDLVSLLCLESRRARCLIIGEDLGTVPPGFRSKLRRRGILGTSVVRFERTMDGGFLPPSRYPYESLCQISTHDMPNMREEWLAWDRKQRFVAADALARMPGLRRLPVRRAAVGFPAVFLRLTRLLAETKTALCLFRVEDVALERRSINVPGTGDEHQNWSLRLRMKLADLLSSRHVQRVWRSVAGVMHFARKREL